MLRNQKQILKLTSIGKADLQNNNEPSERYVDKGLCGVVCCLRRIGITWKEGCSADFKFCCGWISNADSCINLIVLSQMPEILCSRAQCPGQRFSVVFDLLSQQLCQLHQGKFLAKSIDQRQLSAHFIVAIGNGYILQVDCCSKCNASLQLEHLYPYTL